MREEKRERETGDGENGKGKGKGKGKQRKGKGKGKNKIKRKRKKERKNFMYTRKYALKKFGGRTGQCGLGFCAKPQNFKFFGLQELAVLFIKSSSKNILFFTFLCKCLHFFIFIFSIFFIFL